MNQIEINTTLWRKLTLIWCPFPLYSVWQFRLDAEDPCLRLCLENSTTLMLKSDQKSNWHELIGLTLIRKSFLSISLFSLTRTHGRTQSLISLFILPPSSLCLSFPLSLFLSPPSLIPHCLTFSFFLLSFFRLSLSWSHIRFSLISLYFLTAAGCTRRGFYTPPPQNNEKKKLSKCYQSAKY